MAAHRDWIAAEVLANTLEPVDALEGGTDITVGGETLRVKITVV
jgi:hypothetical protein